RAAELGSSTPHGARRPAPDGGGDGLGNLRRTEEEALGLVAPQLGQGPELLAGLDPFGDDPESEGVGEIDDGRDHGHVFRTAVEELVDEGPVDLEIVEGELAEGGERGVA